MTATSTGRSYIVEGIEATDETRAAAGWTTRVRICSESSTNKGVVLEVEALSRAECVRTGPGIVSPGSYTLPRTMRDVYEIYAVTSSSATTDGVVVGNSEHVSYNCKSIVRNTGPRPTRWSGEMVHPQVRASSGGAGAID
jgi:hypothetical protein